MSNRKLPLAFTGFFGLLKSKKLFSLMIGVFLIPLVLYASHFRYGSISWTNASGNTVVFKISQAWRGDAFGPFPSVGSTVNTGEPFAFGDGGSVSIVLTVTSVNNSENWFYGEMTVSHTYAAPGTYTASNASCCRISNLINNGDGNFRTATTVNVGSGNSSPVSSLVPIIDVPSNQAAATFPIPATDPNGSALSYRFATSAEAGPTFSQPSGLSINSSTGVLTFNTIGKSNGQLYSAQVIISDGSVIVPLDFIIRISNTTTGTSPYFVYPPTPTNAQVFNVVAGNNLNFNVQARDDDAGNTVTLSVAGAPIGSTFTPPLPSVGNPASTVFSWTPTLANLGSYILNINAQDNTLRSANTSVTINVISAPTGPIYYSKSTGDLHNVLTWGLNTDGSGANPTDFSDSTFQLANRGSGIYNMTGNWTVGGTVNIPTSSELRINGFSLSIAEKAGTGTFSGSAASNLTTLASGNPIALDFTAGSQALNDLTINSGSNATLNTVLNLYNAISINGMFTLAHQHFPLLIMKSTASNTARIAPITGTLVQDAPVQVERYIPARRAWRILSAPVGGVSGAATGGASLTHAQETVQGALVTSSGSPRPLSFGNATFSLNAAQTEMTMSVTVFNLDVTGSQTPGDNNDNLMAAHIHVGAAPGENAPVRWGFFGAPDNDVNPKQLSITPFASGVGGTFTSIWDVSEGNGGTTLTTNLPGILAGLSYINFHTVQFPGGEIRGQISLAGTGTQTVNQAWQEGSILGVSPNPNPFPGYGTHITGGPVFGSTSNGFDQNPEGAASSLKTYNSTVNNWVDYPNTNITPVGAHAFMTFVRGDRGIPLSFNTVPPTSTTLRATGSLKVGDQTFPVSGSGFTAIPNPFASPINFATITRNGVQNNFYVWDPKMGGANGVGAYVLLSFNGASYDVIPASVSPESQYIQSGQGFMVRPSAAGVAGSITIKESDKSATPAMDVFRTTGGGRSAASGMPVIADPNTGQGIRVTLQVVNDDRSIAVADEVFASYKSQFSDKVDDLDAAKMDNVQENLGLISEGKTLMAERRSQLKEGDVLALKLWNTTAKTYLLEINPTGLSGLGLSAVLDDKYLNTSMPISLHTKSQISFMVNGNSASARADRFQVRIIKGGLDEITKNTITAYPNPIVNKNISLMFDNKAAGQYNVTIVNSIGQVVLRKAIQHAGGTSLQTLTLDKMLTKGTYQLKIEGKETSTNISVISNQ
ncbi:MAG: CHRD domain-containing protein [Chitinophagaceae bacterium]|nr:MAG: CHRD domain-containing protein [Chitinophagaceae bacterium]